MFVFRFAAPLGGHLLICGPFFNNGEVQGPGMSIGGHIRISSGTPNSGTPLSISIPWMWPPHSNSHHQDYSIFGRESQPKPSFATGILGRGPHPKYTILPMGFLWEWYGMAGWASPPVRPGSRLLVDL